MVAAVDLKSRHEAQARMNAPDITTLKGLRDRATFIGVPLGCVRGGGVRRWARLGRIHAGVHRAVLLGGALRRHVAALTVLALRAHSRHRRQSPHDTRIRRRCRGVNTGKPAHRSARPKRS